MVAGAGLWLQSDPVRLWPARKPRECSPHQMTMGRGRFLVARSCHAHEHAGREAADQDPGKNHTHSNVHRTSLGRKRRRGR